MMQRFALIIFVGLTMANLVQAQLANVPDSSPVNNLTPPLPIVPQTLNELLPPPKPPADPFAWDAMYKEYMAQTNETASHLIFNVTNVSPNEVIILRLRPSCGCTVAQMPAIPWRLAAGTSGKIEVSTDLRGKRGVLNKYVTVETSAGIRILRMKITIPDLPIASNVMGSRNQNMMVALADRQAVFRGDCARCHVTPTEGKQGMVLYDAACGICHDSEHRASMVPDLRANTQTHSQAYWHSWISTGRTNTLMPGFAKSLGGPLTEDQINSLVDYCMSELRQPDRNLKTPGVPVPQPKR